MGENQHSMGNLARAMPTVRSTSPPPDVIDLVCDLGELSRLIIEHNRRVMSGEPADWPALAVAFACAAKECRRQTMPALNDIGDSGAR